MLINMNGAENGQKPDFSVKYHLGKVVGRRHTALTHLYQRNATKNNLIIASDQTGHVQLTTIFSKGGNTNTFTGAVKLIQS